MLLPQFLVKGVNVASLHCFKRVNDELNAAD